MAQWDFFDLVLQRYVDDAACLKLDNTTPEKDAHTYCSWPLPGARSAHNMQGRHIFELRFE